jgi:tetratricopeptide (TPR) repeat protein
VPILVIPAGNDVGYDPDRSFLDPSTPKAERDRFADEFLAARSLEKSDPDAALAAFRALIDRQPLFAESHFRLTQLLQAKGQIDEARAEYAIARDGLPMRCPSEFQDAYRKLAAELPAVVLVDAPAVLAEFSPTKLWDDTLFHDGQHPSFRWAADCGRAAGFWGRLASSRYDPSERKARQQAHADPRVEPEGCPTRGHGRAGSGNQAGRVPVKGQPHPAEMLNRQRTIPQAGGLPCGL